ncbi:MAG: hypothetical protein GY816_19140 [Cytophagales bacterium]|nr:hypothetical protein [Cytophagales bacterium]
MKLREKYKVLQNSASMKERIVKSVHATMMLEDQNVSVNRLYQLYDEVKATS